MASHSGPVAEGRHVIRMPSDLQTATPIWSLRQGPRPLSGKLQIFGRWPVAGRDVSGGFFRLRRRVQGRAQALDWVRVQT
jgi:hypothetical protein